MRKTGILTLIASSLAILAGVAFAPNAAQAQPDPAVLAAHNALHAAWAKYDADAIGKMLSDDVVWITRGGGFQDKATVIAAFRRRTFTIPDHSENTRIRVYGSLGVVTTIDAGTNPATKEFHKTAVTEVWSKQGNVWMLVSYQGTPSPVQP